MKNVSVKLLPLILIFAASALAQGTDCAADGSVVNSVTGEPIVRAHVAFTAARNVYSATTNSSGQWALANVGCGAGQLIVTRAGFLQSGSRPAGAIQQLNLVSGLPLHDIKAHLVPQSVAVGKVLDDQGDPIQNVQINAMSARVVDGRLRFQQTGTASTNDLGEYRLASLASGKYIFCAHSNPAPGPLAVQTITADSCYPGPPEGGAASAMDVAAGRESKVDFTMSQIVAIHIRGTVTGLPEGRTLGVALTRRGSEIGPGAPAYPAQAQNGKFDFRVPPGSYMLTADYFEGGKRFSARVPVDAGSSDVDNVLVHLDTTFSVTGVVRVVSSSGRAPGQFGFMLRPSESVVGTGQLKWDPDHTSFTMTDMVPGSFRVDPNPPAGFYVASATLAGQDILHNEIPISQAAGPIEITLRDDGGAIEGDIVDAAGQPAAAGVLLLKGSTRAANLIQPNGHFKLQGIAPGDYTIYAFDDVTSVQYADPDWMRRNGTGGASVTVSAGQTTQLKLTQQTAPN